MLKLISAKTLVVGFGVALSVLSCNGGSVLAATADSVAPAAYVPVEVVPVCASSTNGKAVWTAANKNSDAVTINWLNNDTNVSGSQIAQGKIGNEASHPTTFVTDYRTGLNNRTSFTVGTDSFSTNAQNAECNADQLAAAGLSQTPVTPPVVTPPVVTPPVVQPATCKHDTEIVSSDIHVTYLDRHTVRVSYAGSLPLCDDAKVQINFSGYLIANDDFNGQPLANNPTALPQYIYDNDSAYLTSQNSSFTLQIANYAALTDEAGKPLVLVNDQCFNGQTDVYYGAVLEAVLDTNGHGTRNILSQINPVEINPLQDENLDKCFAVLGDETPTHNTTPGKGAGTTTAKAPVAATTATTSAAAVELPDTGANYTGAALFGLLLGAMSFVLSMAWFKRYSTNVR